MSSNEKQVIDRYGDGSREDKRAETQELTIWNFIIQRNMQANILTMRHP